MKKIFLYFIVLILVNSSALTASAKNAPTPENDISLSPPELNQNIEDVITKQILTSMKILPNI